MKLLINIIFCFISSACFAQIADPISDYRQTFSSLPATETLIKWESDINNDGKNEIFITDKSSYDEDISNGESPSWKMYIATQNGYIKCNEIHDGDNITYGSLVEINIKSAFIGSITEISDAKGIVTEQIKNPRTGDPIAVMQAYVIENGYLKVTKLVEYSPKEGNLLFNKYLKEGKRTVITSIEVKP